MEKISFRLGLFLVAVVIAVQVFIFYKEYDGAEYAGEGVKMAEDTYLYAYDELTVWIEGTGSLENLLLYKNGEAVAGNLTEPYTFTVRENDLIELAADKQEGSGVEVHLSLKDNLFDEKYYVNVFDFSGGHVIAGRFVVK